MKISNSVKWQLFWRENSNTNFLSKERRKYWILGHKSGILWCRLFTHLLFCQKACLKGQSPVRQKFWTTGKQVDDVALLVETCSFVGQWVAPTLINLGSHFLESNKGMFCGYCCEIQRFFTTTKISFESGVQKIMLTKHEIIY